MSTFADAFPRDTNRVPFTAYGMLTTTPTTLTGSSATVNVPLWHVTGTVLITGLFGVVTTDLGANHTAAAWRINDQTAQVYLTAVGGVDLSGKKAGSLVVKKGVVATAASAIDNVAGAILEPTTLETMMFSQVMVTKKTGAVTDIEYHYATTDAPTSGVIQHWCYYVPISRDGELTVI